MQPKIGMLLQTETRLENFTEDLEYISLLSHSME